MKRLSLIPLILALSFCASSDSGDSTSGRPSLSIEIVPNPIVAHAVSGAQYDFPFDVVLRSGGGRSLEIESITANVLAFGSIRVAQEEYDATRLRALGFPTRIGADSELHYRFAPRKSVPDDRLFGGVVAELTVISHDATGTPASATTRVTVTR